MTGEDLTWDEILCCIKKKFQRDGHVQIVTPKRVYLLSKDMAGHKYRVTFFYEGEPEGHQGFAYLNSAVQYFAIHIKRDTLLRQLYD
jgi:hypothetical protein